MKKLLIATLLLATTTMGATTYATTLQGTQDKLEEVTTTTNAITLEQVIESLEEVQTMLDNGENPREQVNSLLELMPQLVEQNIPVVGDDLSQVSYFLELEKARQDTEEFASWLDTLEVAQPMSNVELQEILGE